MGGLRTAAPKQGKPVRPHATVGVRRVDASSRVLVTRAVRWEGGHEWGQEKASKGRTGGPLGLAIVAWVQGE